MKAASRAGIVVAAVATLTLWCPELGAQDWAQFLGPDGDGTSTQTGLLREWPASGPEVLWTKSLGRGYGGPVIKAGRAYILDRDDAVGDVMRCIDMRTGEELWSYAYDSPGELPFPGSRSVPVVDERHVYSVGPNGDLYCIDINTRQPVWNKNVWTDFGGGDLPTWGISQCPVIYGDMLIVASQAPDAGVVAYNKLTGAVVWKTPSLGNIGYSSPVVLKLHGEDQIVFVNSSNNPFGGGGVEGTKGVVVGLDPRSGRELWRYADWDCHIQVASPADAGDNRLLIVGGYERGATMIRVEKAADGTFSTRELYTTLDFGDQTKPALIHNGHAYAQYFTNNKREGLVCMDLSDGTIKWKTGRNPNFDRGSMILADGLILATDGLRSLYLIEPDITAFKPIAKTDMLGEGGASMEGMSAVGGASQNWGPMALSDGRLLVRDQRGMVCLKITR
jgi:outer membrane protein assembly factor BamB